MKMRQRLTKASAFFLFLLPLFFVAHGYTENYGLVPLPDALFLVMLYCIVAVLLTGVFVFFFCSWRKAALYTTALFAFHFFFGSVQDGLKKGFAGGLPSHYSFLLPFATVVFIALFSYLKRSQRTFARLATYINTLLLIFLTIEAVSLAIKINRFPDMHPALLSSLLPCKACDKPDVYFIVADEYAGEAQLSAQFSYNDHAFFESLRQRGFHVVPHPRSNYNFTPFSMASITNFSYLPIHNSKHTVPDEPVIVQMIAENSLTKFFYSQGYTIVNNGIFDIPGQPSQAHSSFLPNKTQYITAQTFLSRVYKDIYFNLITRFKVPWIVNSAVYNNRDANAYLFAKTIETAQHRTGPTFSYTHLSMPHSPYYFDSTGRALRMDSLFDEKNKAAYLSYLKYTNGQLLSLIDAVNKASAKPPLFVLMSDHGWRNFSMQKPADSSYYFSNLLAVSFPQKNYETIPDSLTAVNVFRVILNAQFGQHLPLLRDSLFTLKD